MGKINTVSGSLSGDWEVRDQKVSSECQSSHTQSECGFSVRRCRGEILIQLLLISQHYGKSLKKCTIKWEIRPKRVFSNCSKAGEKEIMTS